MKTILFQGDSITDVGRGRENDRVLGGGYPKLIAARMNFDHPGENDFHNRAISGHRITDLYTRIKADFINVQPDVLSILIGINDVWHEIDYQNGVATDKFEKIYSMMIEEIQAACPKTKIMILEPFFARSPKNPENFSDAALQDVLAHAAAAKRIAEKYHLTFVPLQAKFDEMAKVQPEPYWTVEGVHPTEAGHELIAREWVRAFESMED